VAAISEAEAIRAYPELDALRMIRDAGWVFRPRLDEPGELVGIDGWRDWPGGWRDAIGIGGSTDACAIRLHVDVIVWDFAGTLTDVVAEVLVLPAPSERSAPRLVVGSAPLWVP
jgi:hypothetical protein